MNLVIIQTLDMKFLIPVSRFEPFIFRDMGNTLEHSANVLLEENACKGSYGSSEKWRSMWWIIIDSFGLKSGKIISSEVLGTIQTSLTTVHRSVIFKNLKKQQQKLHFIGKVSLISNVMTFRHKIYNLIIVKIKYEE